MGGSLGVGAGTPPIDPVREQRRLPLLWFARRGLAPAPDIRVGRCDGSLNPPKVLEAPSSVPPRQTAPARCAATRTPPGGIRDRGEGPRGFVPGDARHQPLSARTSPTSTRPTASRRRRPVWALSRVRRPLARGPLRMSSGTTWTRHGVPPDTP